MCLAVLYPGGVPNGAPLCNIANAIMPYLDGFRAFETIQNTLGSSRRIFTTTGGYMALGPAEFRSGDLVCLLAGGAIPWVIRQDGDDYILIEECYVHGVMDGEVMQTEKIPIQDIVLK